MSGLRWSPTEDRILECHWAQATRAEIADKLPGRTASSVGQRARKLGLTRDSTAIQVLANTRYTHDKTFFAEPNLQNSYWAGFLAADGCIKPRRTLSLSQNPDDVTHLAQFCRAIQFTGPIRYNPPRRNNPLVAHGRGIFEVSIHGSDKLIADLEQNFMVTRRKSNTLNPPMGLNRENELAYIAGYIDGDGSVFVSDRKRGYPSDRYPTIVVVGLKSVVGWIRETILDEFYGSLETTKNPEMTFHKSANRYCFRVHGTRASRFASWIYDYQITVMGRKWNTIFGFLPQSQEVR